MATLNPKIKEDLALLYDYPEFRALEKWNQFHLQKCAEQIINVVMGQPGSSERVAMLQGQAEAHKIMMEELRKIHKDHKLKD